MSLVVLLLLLVLVILLTCIKYRLTAFYDSTKSDDNFTANAKVTWLFGIVRIYYNTAEPDNSLVIKVLWFNLSNKKKQKPVHVKPEKKPAAVVEAEPEKVKETLTLQVPEKTPIPEKVIAEEKTITEIPKKKKFSLRRTINSIIKKTKSFRSNILIKIKSIKIKIKELFSNIETVLNYPDKDLILSYTLQFLKKFVKSLGIKKMITNGVVGFTDPSLTGQLLGVLSIIKSKKIELNIDGDFDIDYDSPESKNKIVIDGYLYGRTSLIKLSIPLITYILKKPIWKIVKERIINK